MGRLYPEVPFVPDPKYGRTFEAGYVPIELDSEDDAVARIIEALDAGKSDREAQSAGLNGSDEVPRVKRLLAEVLAERDALRAMGDDLDGIRRAAVVLDGDRFADAQALVIAARPEPIEPVAPLIETIPESLRLAETAEMDVVEFGDDAELLEIDPFAETDVIEYPEPSAEEDTPIVDDEVDGYWNS